MSTWGDVVSHLRATKQLARDEADWLGLFIKFGDAAIEIQRVRVVAASALGRPWVIVLAEICRETRLAARDALVYNGELSYGAIAIEGEHLVFRIALPLARLTMEELDLAIELGAREAVKLRKRAHAAGDRASFHEFAD